MEKGRTKYSTVGRCIYCGTTADSLSKEHIIPLGLNGDLILKRASCKKHTAITGKFETTCLHLMFGPTRIRLGLKTRRPKRRPEELPLIVAHRDGRIETRTIPAKEYPLVISGLLFDTCDFVLGNPPTDQIRHNFWYQFLDEEVKKFAVDGGPGIKIASVAPYEFAQMLAKIAHSFAVAELGYGTFTPNLIDLIDGTSGEQTAPEPDQRGLHRLECGTVDIRGKHYIAVAIQLFCSFGARRYNVIVGEVKTPSG